MEILDKDIVLMVQGGNMFIGKGNTDVYILEDAVQLLPVMTPQGPSYVGVLIGQVKFVFSDNLIISIVDKKSPFYTQYFEVVSDIKIA